MEDDVIVLDLRKMIRDGLQPCDPIQEAASRVRLGQKLLLVVPFEPKPLYDVLAAQGFSRQARRTDAGDWEVLFERVALNPEGDKAPRPGATSACPNCSPSA